MAPKKRWNWRAGLVGMNTRREQPFPSLLHIQTKYIDTVLQSYAYNFVHAAKALGISRATLYRKVHRYLGSFSKLSARRKRARLMSTQTDS